MKNDVCIMLTNYNHASYIKDCIESLLCQTYQRFDLFIFDDCSNDGSYEYLTSLESERKSERKVRVFRNEENKGFIATLNYAKSIIPEEYDFIFRVDSDDVYNINALELLINEIKSSRVDVVGSFIETFGAEHQCYKFPIKNDSIVKALLLGSPITHSGVLIRTDFYKKVFYNKNYVYCEDYKLWVDLYKQGAVFGNVPEFLLKYRKHNSNATKKTTSNKVSFLLTEIRKTHALNILENEYINIIKNLNTPSYIDEHISELDSFILSFSNAHDHYLNDFVANFFIGYVRRNAGLRIKTKIHILKTILKLSNKIKPIFIWSTIISVLNVQADGKIYIMLKWIYGKINEKL